MTTTTKTASIWVNIQTGEWRCEKHAGTELGSRIAAYPKKHMHMTPFGIYQRANENEIAGMVMEFGYACETCKWG